MYPLKTNLSTLLTVFLLSIVPGSATGEDIELTAVDGTLLKATYTSPGNPGPGILLLHQCNRDRTMWTDLETTLVEAGIHVLSLDLRGFGDSQGEGLRGSGGFQAFMQHSTRDVNIAYEYLLYRAGAGPANMGVGGASCGAMLSADLASRNDTIRTLLLLSGPPSGGAVAHIVATPELAVFAAATTGDTITPGVAERLQGAVDGSSHPDSTAMIFAGSEHGMPMFAVNPDLQPAMTAWLIKLLSRK